MQPRKPRKLTPTTSEDDPKVQRAVKPSRHVKVLDPVARATKGGADLFRLVQSMDAAKLMRLANRMGSAPPNPEEIGPGGLFLWSMAFSWVLQQVQLKGGDPSVVKIKPLEPRRSV